MLQSKTRIILLIAWGAVAFLPTERSLLCAMELSLPASVAGAPGSADLLHAVAVEPAAIVLAFRGSGGTLSLFKLAAIWLVFLAWVATADWVNRDGQLTRQNYNVWNGVVCITFLVVLLISLGPFGIPFAVAIVILLVAYAAPTVVYICVRNGNVASHEQVLTPDHLRHLLTGKEKLASYEKGAAVDLAAQGGESERDDSANLLLARQSPGYVTLKDLLADLVHERGDAVMLDRRADSVAVRYQVDGIWHNNEARDPETGEFLIGVMKTLSSLDQNERRKKQTGTFGAKMDAGKFTCRVTCQGTEAGERVVVKLDEGKHSFETLESLGMRSKMRERFLEMIGGDRGFVLFSSLPSGGLTTTVDVSLEETDRLLRNFVAIEDVAKPELEVQNVEVTTYHRAGGEAPATVLPKLLRTYPDVIVVRDLFDAETVKILCAQVEENRLIFASNHGKNAADALLRVLALKVPPRELAGAITAVLYVRLVRKLCPTCRVGYEPTPDLLKKLGIPAGRVEALYREPNPDEVDKVCAECGGIGYLGRTGMFELLVADDGVRQALVKTPKVDLVKKAARAAGMRSLQEEGIVLVAKGITSLPELMRVLKQ
ncbi:MAG: GspE/PulE family protein [Pirellulales bacterium]